MKHYVVEAQALSSTTWEMIYQTDDPDKARRYDDAMLPSEEVRATRKAGRWWAMNRRRVTRLLVVAWCVLLMFVGQQVGMTLQGRPSAALLALAVTVGGAALAWRRWKR